MRLKLLACGAVVGFQAVQPVTAKPEVKARTPLEHNCSRTVSRAVRKELQNEVLKVAAKEGWEKWPQGCPFEPTVDLYGEHEKKKQRNRASQGSGTWTCGICGKSFKNEHYLDLHLERRHMEETPSNGICLADYCEVFEVCAHDSRRKNGRIQADECDAGALSIARRRCEDALRTCFPLDQEISRGLHAKMSRHFCQVLDCRIRDERRKEQEAMPVPVIVLLILVVLVGFIAFSLVVCCVDYSDDIVQFMVESRVASLGCARRILKAREQTRTAVGISRTKAI